jgi:ribosomal subunit interface protein
MQINISGKNMDTGGAFQDQAKTSLDAAVSKYFDRAISGNITLIKSTSHFETRIRVNLTKKIVMEAMGQAGDAHRSLHQAIDHIEKRLRRYKRRLKNHRTESDPFLPATFTLFDTSRDQDVSELPEENAAPPIMAEMDYEVHLMTVEEAVMALELSGESALMFRNKSHDGLNMLHRREDGSIGWVDPRGTRELTH